MIIQQKYFIDYIMHYSCNPNERTVKIPYVYESQLIGGLETMNSRHRLGAIEPKKSLHLKKVHLKKVSENISMNSITKPISTK